MSELRERTARERAGAEGDQEESLPLETVRQVVELLVESGVGEITVRRGELEVSVKAKGEAAPVVQPAFQRSEAPAAPETPDSGPEWEGLHVVRSPIVGTFYRAPAPGEEPYVEVGDRVSAGQTLCIVEAMKLMNEIPSEVAGVVREILVEDTSGVQYDQPLFVIEPEE
ncbi:acetyl-CoA carboxylase biotin carboxyl carrier protein [Rubrobacter taiwanensis]|uniref:acetyl-CoA carboxylase biotin carboxyl carrier protein n=1 Tax=Rubrobacter taiwanensis TaxID=185139 RepID=UPI0014047020|nr:acetyl-CoA carboxylase biotin carboxyl carrier protein [Rubrobacter taiwanensis]